ncbi:hypothetical protein BJF85_20115 [Saccharomonospora sp. CUA-673]|uniref:hypothetical protein n=1 Tax=Saccharomonospora sp. CUA-673 TaxID=1904969 RepID=UPI0009603BD2|nr:hypothetical protein [Saccharomonospora sp. CUA-673]OLT44190.1 hypothetical protein BJF85_20115 [Saccharomonospora sp. CUA-673]
MATKTTETESKTTAEQIKTPLLAALGAGNLASKAVNDALGKARSRYSETNESVRKSVEEARKNFEDLPSEISSLTGKLEPAELRKLLDEYTEAALKLYRRFAESGEETWDKFIAQEQVKKATDQIGETFQTVQTRVDEATSDVRKGIDEVVSKVTSTVKGAGEDAGEVVSATAEKITGAAEKAETAVEEATTTSKPKTSSASKSTTKSTTTRRTTSSAATKKSTGGSTKSEK